MQDAPTTSRFPVRAMDARALRQSLGFGPGELARLLRIGTSTLHRYETEGAPAWLPMAIAGLALFRNGRGVAEVCSFLGLDPDGGRPPLGCGASDRARSLA